MNPIVRMFEWWNVAFTHPDGFTPGAFARHYTGSAQLIVNGESRGTGPDAIAQHYRRLQGSFENIAMELPVIDSFECGNRAFVQCVTRAVRDGQIVREEAMAAATLADGRIQLLTVLGGRRLD